MINVDINVCMFINAMIASHVFVQIKIRFDHHVQAMFREHLDYQATVHTRAYKVTLS